MWTTDKLVGRCKTAIGYYNGLSACRGIFTGEKGDARRDQFARLVSFIASRGIPAEEALVQIYDFYEATDPSNRLVNNIRDVLMDAAGIHQQTLFEQQYVDQLKQDSDKARLQHFIKELREGLGQVGEWEDPAQNVMLMTFHNGFA